MRKFEQFIKERRYLQNVSERTVQWYYESLKWLRVEEPTEADLKDFVDRMGEKNLKPMGGQATSFERPLKYLAV